MAGLRRTLATSDHIAAQTVRAARHRLLRISLPAPRFLVVPLRLVYTAIRSVSHELVRLCVAEPIFKSYCTQVGRRFRTGAFVHWVNGRGRIIIGDDVLIDGKCSFTFAARYRDHPTLRIGDRTGIGHACVFVVASEIVIGSDCRIAGGASFRDSPGHPLDPEARRRGEPPSADAIKPIVIDDNVWIGSGAIVHGGVHIGTGSVISSGAVVLSDVPAGSLVAGNPGRRIGVVTPAPVTPVTTTAPDPDPNPS